MTNQTETTKPEAPTDAGGQVERVVRRPLSCDQVAWLLDVFTRYLPQESDKDFLYNRPRVSRQGEMLKYGMLYEVMEVADLKFADDAARWNGTPQDARKHEKDA